ncbi:uncharacterized protein LOC134133281 [Pungitius pungitius]|uniref:uncharacterized protein LOC134133281 n=1 Tax=Pungitius pungitius TaxID=134920 RepID=UPI002E0FBB21
MDLTRLTRKHGVKVPPGFPCSVEDCSLAVGEMVGHGSVKSAARMNNAVVLFVDSVDKANMVVEKGIVVNQTRVPVLPLATPATRVTVSNVPPFIGDEMLTRELSRHGKVVSGVKKVTSGCKSPLLRHVVSHKRTLYMLLNQKDEDLNVVFKVRVDGFDYLVFANSDSSRCYRCGREGHQSRACPERKSTSHNQGGHERQEGTVGVQQGGEEGTDRVQESVASEGGERGVQLVERGTGGVKDLTGGAQQVGKANDWVNEGMSEAQQVGQANDRVNEGMSEAQQVGQANDGVNEGTSEAQQVGQANDGVNEGTSEAHVGRVKLFLKTTKNMKGIQLEDYFPDMEKFRRTAREGASKRGSSRYTQQEVFRLRKFVQRINERAAVD